MPGASARDIAEFASGRASSGDKREMGFVKQAGRLVPGKHTPRGIKRVVHVRKQVHHTKRRHVRRPS